MSEQPRSILLPPVILVLAAVVEVLIRVMPGAEFVTPPWDRIGWVLLVAGIAIAAWAASTFRRKDTPVMPYETPKALVTSGPFRFTRNPMYLGMTMVLFAEAFLLRRLLAFLVPFVFMSVIRRRFIIFEEERLVKNFGADAEAYLAKTRRWL